MSRQRHELWIWLYICIYIYTSLTLTNPSLRNCLIIQPFSKSQKSALQLSRLNLFKWSVRKHALISFELLWQCSRTHCWLAHLTRVSWGHSERVHSKLFNSWGPQCLWGRSLASSIKPISIERLCCYIKSLTWNIKVIILFSSNSGGEQSLFYSCK